MDSPSILTSLTAPHGVPLALLRRELSRRATLVVGIDLL